MLLKGFPGLILSFRGLCSRRTQTIRGRRLWTSSSMTERVSDLTVPVPWGVLRGKVWGPEHGYPVLCLHGWADNCGTFNTLIPLLPKECRFVAIDFPGHGLSSHRPPGVLYTFPSYVMDVRRVVEALQWRKFSVIGHSMGGNVGGMFSALFPEMVDALVLVDSFGFLPTELKKLAKVMRQGVEDMIQFEKRMEEDKKVYSYEKALERLLSANRHLSEESAKILLERGVVPVEGGVVFSRDFRINLKNVARTSAEQVLELHSKIKASVLVLLADNGFENMFIEPEQKTFVSDILQAFKDHNHSVVNLHGDHHVHLNNPEVVAPLVSNFLKNKVLSPSAFHTSNL